MPIRVKVHGSFDNSRSWLQRLREEKYLRVLDAAGRAGVAALESETPKDTGATSSQWRYEIVRNQNGVSVHWTNDSLGDGWYPVAIGLQYGHGTGTGGWVEGQDYINPAMRPIFETIANNVSKEIQSL